MASKFDSAFAAARKAGKKEFKFGGKSYNTKLAKEPKSNGLPDTMKVPGKAGRGVDFASAQKTADKLKKPVSMAPPSAKSAKNPQSPLDVLKSGVRVGASAVSRGKTVDAAQKANKPAAKGGANFMQKLVQRKILGK